MDKMNLLYPATVIATLLLSGLITVATANDAAIAKKPGKADADMQQVLNSLQFLSGKPIVLYEANDAQDFTTGEMKQTLAKAAD